jgi:hypothetical protein
VEGPSTLRKFNLEKGHSAKRINVQINENITKEVYSAEALHLPALM